MLYGTQTNLLKNSFYKEMAAYIELSGGYILKTYGFAVDKKTDKTSYMIITEFMPYGSLANVLKDKGKISFRQKVRMARQIASGMKKIHDHHMIHRDIRPDNILVHQKYTCKIGDMGIARYLDPMNQHTLIGHKFYMPPEFYNGKYDQKLDIFTFGLTLYELFTEKRHDFQPSSTNIVLGTRSPIFQDLITRCIANDPKERPQAIEIEKTLQLYGRKFDKSVLKNNSEYDDLSTKEKNRVFIEFYEKFHDTAVQLLQKKFLKRSRWAFWKT